MKTPAFSQHCVIRNHFLNGQQLTSTLCCHLVNCIIVFSNAFPNMHILVFWIDIVEITPYKYNIKYRFVIQPVLSLLVYVANTT